MCFVVDALFFAPTSDVNPSNYKVLSLSRYDQKSLYNKKPIVTEIMSRGQLPWGILEANDRSIWFGAFDGVYRYDGKTITDFKSNKRHK